MAKKAAKKKVVKAKTTTRGQLVSGPKKAVKKAVVKKVAVKKAAAKKAPLKVVLKKSRANDATKVPTTTPRVRKPATTTTFTPLPTHKLAGVDRAKCPYSKELTEIVGVVSFGGQGGWAGGNDAHVHCFDFAAWRRIGEPLVKTSLTILRPVLENSDYFSEYPEGSIHKVRLLLSVDETRAVFSESLKRDARDAELKSVADELRKPVVIETERFGPLTLNRQIDWFEGEAIWNGIPIRISFEAGNAVDLAPLLDTAGCLFDDSVRWGKAVNDFAVKEKLELANDWNEEDGKVITAEDFLSRMELTSIAIQSDGQFDFWHDDGDLFWGHSIQIKGSLTKGLTRSDIPG